MTPEQVYRSHRWRVLRASVLRRDRWRCRLCGQAIDPRAPMRSAWSASVDHVRPLLQGGAPYDPANCRAVHVICNTQRAGTVNRVGRYPLR